MRGANRGGYPSRLKYRSGSNPLTKWTGLPGQGFQVAGLHAPHLQDRHPARTRREESCAPRRDAFRVHLPGNHQHSSPDTSDSEISTSPPHYTLVLTCAATALRSSQILALRWGVYLARGMLFAQTANTVHALHPETGQTILSFCPYGDSGESIYSSPTVYGNSVFIGERRGYLHCLDSRSGSTRWKPCQQAKNCDLNSTPLVAPGANCVLTQAMTFPVEPFILFSSCTAAISSNSP